MSAGQFNSEIEIIIGTNVDDGMNSLLGALADNSLFDYYQATFNTTAPMQIFDIPFESGMYTIEYQIYTNTFTKCLFASDITPKDLQNAYKIVKYYIDSIENINLEHKQGLFDLFTDSGFLYGTYKTINYLIEKGVTVYQYILSYEGEFSFSEIYGVPPNGVCHADDQLYLWNPWLLGPLSGDDVTGHLLLLSHKEKLDFMLDLTLLGTKVK